CLSLGPALAGRFGIMRQARLTFGPTLALRFGITRHPRLPLGPALAADFGRWRQLGLPLRPTMSIGVAVCTNGSVGAILDHPRALRAANLDAPRPGGFGLGYAQGQLTVGASGFDLIGVYGRGEGETAHKAAGAPLA